MPSAEPSSDKAATCTLITFGCKVNQYESQALREMLLAAGWREAAAASGTPCDVAVVNTCTVTAAARRKSLRAVRKAEARRVVVTGCLAETEPELFAAMGDRVIVLPKAHAAQIVRRLCGDASAPRTANGATPPSVFDLRIAGFEGHSRAFLKVQDGCDAGCAYCIVPRARGRPVSRPRDEVRREAERLAASGFREIVLCGVHLGAYGRDLSAAASLEDLVEDLLSLAGVQRLRLSSIEVNEVSDRLIALMASAPALCPHLHVPLQSGDDAVLRAMGRRYTVEEFLRVLERVQERVACPSFTTDVMVGFPGESRGAFENTLRACRRAGFSRIHVFPFSARPGTPAARRGGRVPSAEVRTREREVQALARDLAGEYKQRFVGSVVHPLVEHRRDAATGLLCGYTERYVRAVFTASGVGRSGPCALMGRIVPVFVASAGHDSVRGHCTDGLARQT